MGSAKENSGLSGFSGHSKPAYAGGGMNYAKRNSNDLGELPLLLLLISQSTPALRFRTPIALFSAHLPSRHALRSRHCQVIYTLIFIANYSFKTQSRNKVDI